MEGVKALIQEYGTRFKETRFAKKSLAPRGTSHRVIIDDDYLVVDSVVICKRKTREWAIANLKELPRKWVVRKDRENPIWKEFEKWYREEHRVNFEFQREYYSSLRNDIGDSILDFEDFQYLTLEQWKEFVLGETLTLGSYGIFYSDSKLYWSISTLKSILKTDDEILYESENLSIFKNFFPIDITKPLPEEMERFKKEAKVNN